MRFRVKMRSVTLDRSENMDIGANVGCTASVCVCGHTTIASWAWWLFSRSCEHIPFNVPVMCWFGLPMGTARVASTTARKLHGIGIFCMYVGFANTHHISTTGSIVGQTEVLRTTQLWCDLYYTNTITADKKHTTFACTISRHTKYRIIIAVRAAVLFVERPDAKPINSHVRVC